MKIEIRPEIREYILHEVSIMINRLGVRENLYETVAFEGRYNDRLDYRFASAPFYQMPMMFKKAYVAGYMTAVEVKDENDRFYELSKSNNIVVVNLEYEWESFRSGSNGTEIGRVVFAVEKNLPEEFKPSKYRDPREHYVMKLEGLEL